MLRLGRVRLLQRRVLLGGSGVAAGLLAAYRGDANELHFDAATAAQQALQLVDAERAHNIGLWAAKHGLTPRERGPDLPALRTAVWGRQFPNPIGVWRCFPVSCQRPPHITSLSGVASSAGPACMHADTTSRVLQLQMGDGAGVMLTALHMVNCDEASRAVQVWRPALTRMQRRCRACCAWGWASWRSVRCSCLHPAQAHKSTALLPCLIWQLADIEC